MEKKTITTPCGDITGVYYAKRAYAFRGIRYASAERFSDPVVTTSWDGTYDASSFGPACWQVRAFQDEAKMPKERQFYYNEFRKPCAFTYSEDCLRLNIYTPSSFEEGGKLPVVVYIHGGAFMNGSSDEHPFQNPDWTRYGVIGVTLNYRLGPLGALAVPGLSGNYGLKDIIAALEWVKTNISSFGGNPENITVMGQSAGAGMVMCLCYSRKARGLFTKAVMSSFILGDRYRVTEKIESRYAYWQGLMEKLGAKNLEEMKAIPVEKLYAAFGQTLAQNWMIASGYCAPALDGDVLREDDELFDCPTMLGSTSEDLWIEGCLAGSLKWTSLKKTPTWRWYFSRQLPGDNRGAWHSSDLWYWFGTFESCWRPMEKRDDEIRREMLGYLMNFAKNGDPNGPDLPAWKGETYMTIRDDGTGMGNPIAKGKVFGLEEIKGV